MKCTTTTWSDNDKLEVVAMMSDVGKHKLNRGGKIYSEAVVFRLRLFRAQKGGPAMARKNRKMDVVR